MYVECMLKLKRPALKFSLIGMWTRILPSSWTWTHSENVSLLESIYQQIEIIKNHPKLTFGYFYIALESKRDHFIFKCGKCTFDFWNVNIFVLSIKLPETRIELYNLVKHTAIPLWPFDLWCPFGWHSFMKIKIRQYILNKAHITTWLFITFGDVSKCLLFFSMFDSSPIFFVNRVFFDFSVFHFWAMSFNAVLFVLSSRINWSFSVCTRSNSETFPFESSIMQRR